MLKRQMRFLQCLWETKFRLENILFKAMLKRQIWIYKFSKKYYNTKINMPDFNKILTPGDIDNGIINAIIDISQGSSLKIEYERTAGIFKLDRVEPNIFSKPVNYG